MVSSEEILKQISRRTSVLGKVVAVIGPIAVIVGGAFWYFNNIWKPRITLDNVDYEKLVATLTVNGKQRVLYAGSTINAGFGWGIRFSGAIFNEYDRIEIVKNDLTYKTISTKA